MNHPNRSLQKPRPRLRLESLFKRFPDAWKVVDMARSVQTAKVRLWPANTFLPLEHWKFVHKNVGTDDESRFEFEAVAQWRPTQGIYRFDPELYDAIVSTPLEGDIPADVLTRLPEWCVYIETPELVFVTGE